MTARPTRFTILSAALVLLLSGCAGSTSSSGGAPSAASAVSSAAQTGQHSARAGDVAFAQMMIPHHQQAIAMADLALRDSAGASARVRALAQEVKAAQDPEIAKHAPYSTPVRRLDEARAAKQPVLRQPV